MILTILLALVGLVMLIAVWRKAFRTNGGLRLMFGILGVGLLLYGAVGTVGQLGWVDLGSAGQFFLSAGIPSTGTGEVQCPAGTILKNGICVSTSGGGATYQPTASYSAKDKYSTTTISGTSYYKVGSNSATTTAQTNVNVGDQVNYWVSNTSYWIKPVTKTAVAGVNIFEAQGYANSTATVTLYDPVNKQSTTDGAYNTSLGANDVAKVEITYFGTAEGSAGPFGGLMVLEYNSTISQVTCTGSDLTDSNPYHLTYTPSATTHVHKAWAYKPSMDDGSGSVRTINCEVKNSATAVGAGSVYYVKFIPANYYVTQDGNIVLDTEKFADGDNTRTGSTINSPTATAYFGA